jgi:hypothetical protein
MAEGKVEVLNIEIMGKLDPSLIATINAVKARLKELGADARTSNEVLKRAYSQMFDGATRSASKFGAESKSTFRRIAEEAEHAAHRISHSFEHTFKELGMEVAKGFGFAGGFGLAELVGGGIENVKEFARGAIETRGDREVLQNQIRTMSESRGHAYLAGDIDTMIRNMEGRETPQTYNQLMEATALLMSSAPKLYDNVGKLHTQLTKLADVSRDPKAFGLVTQAFTRILAEGKVDAQHLNEMSIDTGYNFKQAMASALKVSPEQLSEMMKKHELTGKQAIAALMKSFDIITGPGGAAYRHAEAQLQGLKGIEARFFGHWQDFQESFGMVLEKFLTPVANKVFELLTPAELTHAFDGLQKVAEGWGRSVAYLVGALTQGNPAAKFAALGGEIQSFFNKVFGLPGTAMFKEQHGGGISGTTDLTVLSDEWKTRLDKFAEDIGTWANAMRETTKFMKENWDYIKDGMIVAAGVWGIGKLKGLIPGYPGAPGIPGGPGTVGKGIVGEVEEGVLLAEGDAIGIVVAKKILGGIKIALGGGALSSGALAEAMTPLRANIYTAIALMLVELGQNLAADAKAHAIDIVKERREHEKKVPGGTVAGDYGPGYPDSPERRASQAHYYEMWLKMRTGMRSYSPAEAYSTPETLQAAPKIRDQINSAAETLSNLPEKTSSISNSFDSSASIATTWPSKATSISSALDSLVSAINSAAARAVSSINVASANAANMLV